MSIGILTLIYVNAATSSPTARAEASNIVSDLRSMKAASLLFLVDSMDEIIKGDVTLDVKYLTR